MATDLNDDDKAIIAELWRDTIMASRYPRSPRIKRLCAILAKLAPAAASTEAFPAPTASAEPSMAQRKRRR